MSKKNNMRQRRGNKANRAIHSNVAPTMNGMQQVGTWNLKQIVPVAIPLTAQYNADEPAVVQFASGVNKWLWDVRQGGIVVTGQTLEYGELTEQFAELAALWSTYRLDSVQIEFVPSQVGAGQQTSIISALQPAGSTQNFDPQDALISLSRLRSVKLHDSRKPAKMRVDYRGWLMQTAPQPFLQTVDLSIGTGVRELYPEDLNNTCPIVRMAFQTTPGVGSVGIALGFFMINARYDVRGRRANVLPVSIRMSMLSDSEQEEALRYLELKRLEKVNAQVVKSIGGDTVSQVFQSIPSTHMTQDKPTNSAR